MGGSVKPYLPLAGVMLTYTLSVSATLVPPPLGWIGMQVSAVPQSPSLHLRAPSLKSKVHSGKGLCQEELSSAALLTFRVLLVVLVVLVWVVEGGMMSDYCTGK